MNRWRLDPIGVMVSLAKRNGDLTKTTYLDPLIPRHETSDETLTRLSANIGTLTGLMNDAERTGLYSLATMFDRARNGKVAQAGEIIARVTAGRKESADERRFLLVPGLPPQRPARSAIPLALTP